MTSIPNPNNTYLDRMKEEHAQLTERVNALAKFIYTKGNTYEELSRVAQVNLAKQLAHMEAYQSILDTRIWVASGG